MFRYEQPILFKHCDPAGIVFYPRYFEMMNDCVEDFFAEVLRWPFSEIHTSAAVPTAEIRTRFIAPSRLGDHLTLMLRVGLALDAGCSGEQRFATELTLVHVDETGKPAKWPEVVSTRLATFKESQEP
jgi:4-hydroxybenzoyl-CoA thioesterase